MNLKILIFFIAADHGNMNGMKGKISYGHDVYETAVNIPLIAPRIDEKRIIDNFSIQY